jgi:enoyl-CoA hydratase/carnithine racemase
MLRLRRKSRADQVVEEVKKIPAAVLIGAGAALSAGLIALGAYFGRHKLWGVVAKVADAVEEVADTVEDAAEDLAEAAQARAAGKSKD